MSTTENKRPSAMKPAVQREPLMGSPVQEPPLKVTRSGENVAMAEDGLAAVPPFPAGSSGSLAPGNFFTTPLVPGKDAQDSPPEHSYACGACYLASCPECGLLPSVIQAAIEAAAVQAQSVEQQGQEKSPDSYPCGGCYMSSCENCGKLPAVIKATAAAVQAHVDLRSSSPAASLPMGPTNFGEFPQQGFSGFNSGGPRIHLVQRVKRVVV